MHSSFITRCRLQVYKCTTTTTILWLWILSRTTWVSWYEKGKPVWISWSKKQLVVVSSAGSYANLHLVPYYYASTPPMSFLHAGCPSCCPTDSVKALKSKHEHKTSCDSNTKICFLFKHVMIVVILTIEVKCVQLS